MREETGDGGSRRVNEWKREQVRCINRQGNRCTSSGSNGEGRVGWGRTESGLGTEGE